MSWKTVHSALSRLARRKGAIDAEEATWLLRAKRERVYAHLGYATLAEYLERIFGYGPRIAYEKLRVAEALSDLPAMRRRLAQADLSWSAARELTRIVTRDTEAQWIAAAAGKTVREVERMVAGRKPGDGPEAPAESGAMRTVLRLEISTDTLAAFREARERCTREVGHRLDDDQLVRMIVERALAAGSPAGAQNEGRSPYQVKLAVCPDCRRGERAAAGELHPLAPERVEQALCDAQLLGALPSTAPSPRQPSQVGSPKPERAPERASQTIPPRIRRRVLRRDGGCMVPGCRNTAFRELHHVVPRSQGGTHDPNLLAELCSAHHTLVHSGELRISGTHDRGFRIEHADGRPYGTAPLAPIPTWATKDHPAPMRTQTVRADPAVRQSVDEGWSPEDAPASVTR